MKKNEMLEQMIAHYTQGHKGKFAQLLGIKPSALSTWISRGTYDAELLFEKCENISAVWLLSGHGNMLSTNDNSQNDKIFANNEYATRKESEQDVIPIIPAKIVNDPTVDVYNYIALNETDVTPKVNQFAPHTAGYRIKTTAMQPYILPGDMLAIEPYPPNCQSIIPGEVYVVATNTNGLVTRLLYNHPDGFLARTYGNDRYPEFVIRFEHIISISHVVGLLRTSMP